MKKIIVGFTMMVFLVAGLYAGKYDDAIALTENMFKVMEDLTTGLETAKDENEVAGAFDKFTESFKKMLPKMVEMNKKYPELKDMQKNPPEELKPLAEKSKAVSQKFMGAMMSVMGKYGESQVVKDAMMRMQQMQAEMQKGMAEAEKKE